MIFICVQVCRWNNISITIMIAQLITYNWDTKICEFNEPYATVNGTSRNLGNAYYHNLTFTSLAAIILIGNIKLQLLFQKTKPR